MVTADCDIDRSRRSVNLEGRDLEGALAPACLRAIVGTPTIHSTTRSKRTRVLRLESELDDRLGERGPHGTISDLTGAIAQRPFFVRTPAPHRAVEEERARGFPSRGYSSGSFDSGDLRRRS
jgi:hypothetical protein